MNPNARRWIQIFLVAAAIVAAGRTALLLYERREPEKAAVTVAPRAVNPDFYVYPPRAYVTDFAGAQQMKGSTVWVRDGNRYACVPYAHRVLEAKDAPLLPPIQRLTIADVVKTRSKDPSREDIYTIVERPDGGSCAVMVGSCNRKGEDCAIVIDQIFFLKDPHQLYSHWKPEVWDEIAHHEIKPGMTETQISFAVGYGRVLDKESRAAGDNQRVVQFGSKLVTFDSNGYAKSVD